MSTDHPTAKGADQLTPDNKDWTWVIEQVCPDCGFEAGAVTAPQVDTWIGTLTAPWPDLLTASGVSERPEPGVWSPLEYGAHVRDVCRVFTDRVRLMLAEDNPEFADWDQDQAARDGDYASLDPIEVDREITGAAETLQAAYAEVEDAPGDGWQRPALRSNGSEFTVLTLAQYLLHDLAHHLMDVGEDVPGAV